MHVVSEEKKGWKLQRVETRSATGYDINKKHKKTLVFFMVVNISGVNEAGCPRPSVSQELFPFSGI